MFSTIRAKSTEMTKKLSDPRNAVMYLVMLIMLAITWSGVKAVQTNYELQKKISTLKQQNAVLQLENENIALQNQYYNSNQYLDLSARQNLGLASPGENVLLIPRDVAMKYVDPSITLSSFEKQATRTNISQPKMVKNLEDWRDFLLGRAIISD